MVSVSRGFKITGNLNFDLTKKIMDEIKSKVEMRTSVLHAFSCIIYRGEGEIVEYSKTFKSNKQATFANFADKTLLKLRINREDLS